MGLALLLCGDASAEKPVHFRLRQIEKGITSTVRGAGGLVLDTGERAVALTVGAVDLTLAASGDLLDFCDDGIHRLLFCPCRCRRWVAKPASETAVWRLISPKDLRRLNSEH